MGQSVPRKTRTAFGSAIKVVELHHHSKVLVLVYFSCFVAQVFVESLVQLEPHHKHVLQDARRKKRECRKIPMTVVILISLRAQSKSKTKTVKLKVKVKVNWRIT